MELGFALVANSAEVSPDGRIFVLSGGIDGYAVPALPAVIRSITLIVQLKFSTQECGKTYSLEVSVRGPDGLEVKNISHSGILAPRDPYFNDRAGKTYTALTIYGLSFEIRGIYKFVFTSNDEEIGAIDFGIVVATEDASQGG